MAKLPTAISGSQLRRALERAGFVMTRQPGTLHHVLNEAGITVDELLQLL